MTDLLLTTQKVTDLERDNQVTHLIITKAWLESDTFKQLNQLSQLYPHVQSIDLSDIDLLRSDPSVIISIATAFPEITKLVLVEGTEKSPKLMQHISHSFKFLVNLSYSEPPQRSEEAFSYLNPSTWRLPFWVPFQPSAAAAASSIQHHDTMRDLFNVSDISKGQSNILSDWNRIGGCLIQINGTPILTMVHADANKHYFPTLDSLKNFFLENLLYKLPHEQQSSALDFVMKTLHQGGLQNPVTASVYQHCASKGSLPQPINALNVRHGIPGQYREMKFNATENGFTVHEILKQNRLAYPITAGDRAGELLLPDEGFDYVFKAEAKLSVHWNTDDASEAPKINIDNVGITFGSAVAQEFFDERWFYQKWIDSASYYVGLNTVDDDTPDSTPPHP